MLFDTNQRRISSIVVLFLVRDFTGVCGNTAQVFITSDVHGFGMRKEFNISWSGTKWCNRWQIPNKPMVTRLGDGIRR